MGKYNDVEKSFDQIAKSFLSGGLAGMVSKTFIAPIERIKILYLVTINIFRLEVLSFGTTLPSKTSFTSLKLTVCSTYGGEI